MNHSPQEPAAPESRKQTVLVVDDNPANLDTVTDYLAEYGFEVLIAQNGKVGLERAQSVHPDMILLDVLMPGMDGFEVCQCLKADAATRNIPVIFMTALAETEHKIRGFQLGAVDYVTKPMQREEVLARVLTHLRLRELNERLEQQVRERTDELVSANQQLQQEIAERRQVETALRESEENYRTLVEQAKDGIAIVQDASVQYVNQYLLEMGGYAAEEVIGSSFDMYVHPDEIARAADRYRRRMAGEPISQIYESALRYKDGRKVEVEINANRITYRGRPADLVIIRDITERKQAETERTQLLMQIQEQAQRVQQIVDTVPEGVLLLDAEGHIVLANPTAAGDLLALASAQVGDILTHLGNRPLDELLTSPPKGLWHELAANGQIFQVIARSLETGPTPGGWVLVIRDVTQQRELDRRVRQRERLAAVGQLAAGIAHDFNNIMATIILYAQMTARSEELPADIRERMATIDQQARHATNLIRQILDFSRRSAIKRQPLDLLPFLKEQVQLLERTLPESIRIELAYEPGEYIVVADLTSMQQMMTNLALNARDAMPQGGRLCIGLERVRIARGGPSPLPEMKAGDWVRMMMSDTGVGIPPDALPHIFEPFFTTKAPGEGSGLGLAQVHGIVGQHEGHIDVETQIGKGTTFVIYLPALPADPESSIAALLEEAPSLASGKGETILIVEDNAAARQVLVESLKLLNYRVLEAAHGQDALRILEQRGEDIALVLSDVVMPIMGGVALLHTLKERGLAVPVVMLTGHPLQEELESLQTQEAASLLMGWLPKPPSLEQLAEAVAQALREEGKGSQ